MRQIDSVSLPLLYRHFLAYQNHLDRVAEAGKKEGKDTSDLRNHHQTKLGFNDSQFAAVRASALRLEAALKTQDAKAAQVIQAERARFPKGRLTRAADLPPIPDELKRLQAERDNMIAAEIATIRSSLGSDAASKLEAFLQRDFASKVKVKFLRTPGRTAPDPQAPPFPKEVRQ